MDYFSQETDRLRFRKLTKEDIPSWLEFFEGNDRLHFLGIGEDSPKSKETIAEEWILAQFARYNEQSLGHLAVELKETSEFIGMGGVLPRELEGKKELEVAYSLKPKFWKKGYGTEIAKQMKHYGSKMLDANRFISIIHIENIDSINVAKKNGMQVLFRTTFLGMTVDVYGVNNK